MSKMLDDKVEESILNKLDVVRKENKKLFHIITDAMFLIKSHKDKRDRIVRCKDCRKHGTVDCQITWETTQETSDDWYCADGERKNGDGDG